MLLFQNMQCNQLHDQESCHHQKIHQIHQILLKLQLSKCRKRLNSICNQFCSHTIDPIQKDQHDQTIHKCNYRHRELPCTFRLIQINLQTRCTEEYERCCTEYNFDQLHYPCHDSSPFTSSYRSSLSIFRPAINLYGAQIISPAVLSGISVFPPSIS